MQTYYIWTNDDVEHKVVAYSKYSAVAQFVENNPYTIEEIMYVAEGENEDI